MTNADKPAFPYSVVSVGDGVSKRELFTAMALSGLCAASRTAISDIPDKAIRLADETLAKLEKTK